MKGIVYRSAALALVLVVACSALALPVSATDYQSTYNFWNWAYDNSWFLGKAIIGFSAGNVCQVSEDSMHHATTHSGGGGSVDGQRVYNCVCDLCGEEFQAVATDLEKSYQNSTVFKVVSSDGLSAGWVELSYTCECYIKAGYEGYGSLSVDGNTFTYNVIAPISTNNLLTVYLYFEVPVACSAQISNMPVVHYNCPMDTAYYYPHYQRYNGSDWVNITSSTYKFVPGVQYRIYSLFTPCCTNLDNGSETFRAYHRFYVEEWYLDSDFIYPIIDTRPVSFAPSFSYTDESGNVQVSVQNIFDELDLNYYNPVTNTTTNITHWTYDYSDRSYTCTTENNTTTTITYGDEYITINEGDVNNTYITYNIYYYTAPENSGDGSGSGSDGEGSGSSGSGDSSDDGDGIGGGLGELLGSLLGGLIDLITGLISGLIDSLINLVEMTIEKLGQVVNLFGEFGDALKVLWSWLPDEVVTILAAGVSVVVFASVIKLFV